MSSRFRSGPAAGAASLLLVSLVLAGCDLERVLDPYGRLAPSYELHRLDGRRLPVLVDEYTASDGARCHVDLVAGSAVFGRDRYDDGGSYELVWAFRETCTLRGGSYVDYYDDADPGEYTISGDVVRFYPHGHSSSFRGEVGGSELVISYGSTRFEYREDDSIGW